MGYDFYFGKTLLPIAPSKLKLKIGNANKTMTLINEGEINILKTPGLTEIDFEIVLPNVEYPFARYKEGFKPAEYFLARLEELKVGKVPFQFIVSRQLPDGEALYGTNMKVSLEEYTIEEDAGEGFDIIVSVQLKQYREYGTKVCSISLDGGKNKATIGQNRANGENVPSGKTYTVKSGDSLWKIAATQLGNGSRWKEIYELNKEIIGDNPNLIYPNHVYVMP